MLRRSDDGGGGTAYRSVMDSTGRTTRWVDALLALAVTGFQVGVTVLAARQQPEHRPLDALAIALLAGSGAALLGRRRWPVAVLWTAFGLSWLYWGLDYPGGPVFVALVVAVVTALLAGHRRAGWWALGLGYVVALVTSVGVRDMSPGVAVGIAAWVLLLGFGAEALRNRRERAAQAARVQAEEARRRAGEQRMGVARELHDVLAHHISMISVQAGVALHLLDERPEQARVALTAIRQASRESLGELRSVLELLRNGDEAAPRSPAPRLEALDALVARTTAAGLPVTLEVVGEPRELPAAVSLAAYRTVQEALTNVVRHAGTASAMVLLGYADAELTVQVDDDGPGAGAPSAGSGSGLLGMAERAAALGGEVEAGPRPGGGFRVRARLPLPARSGAEVAG